MVSLAQGRCLPSVATLGALQTRSGLRFVRPDCAARARWDILFSLILACRPVAFRGRSSKLARRDNQHVDET
eukprot:3086972-Pyramimonas_sp.AAC.2